MWRWAVAVAASGTVPPAAVAVATIPVAVVTAPKPIKDAVAWAGDKAESLVAAGASWFAKKFSKNQKENEVVKGIAKEEGFPYDYSIQRKRLHDEIADTKIGRDVTPEEIRGIIRELMQ